MKFRNFLFFCLFFFICYSAFFVYERTRYNLVTSKELQEVRQKLSVLSPEERKDLAHFFSYALLFCNYPYTLVGYKPMSLCALLQESDDLPSLLQADHERPRHRKWADHLERGYRAWEKYRSLFPIKKYLIVRYHDSVSKGMLKIALIDPKLCLTNIEEYLEDFRKILLRSYNANEIFEILTYPEHANFYGITERHLSLGILLGYGRYNAYLVEHKQRDKLKGFNREWPHWPRKWRLPSFSCDPTTEETKNLKKAYKKARLFIRWTYFNRNDVEVTLALLAKKEG